ncbi:TPA: class A sortase [Enterococcus faecium]|nr:class A sortase [Enterococcus faecium]
MKRKKKNRLKNIVFNSFLIVSVLFFLFLIFNKPIKHKIMEHQITNYQDQIMTVSVDELAENKNKPATYDFDQVQPISDTSVYTSQANLITDKKDPTAFNMIGFVAVPSVSINLPIFQGLYNDNLLYGAGTAKPNQQLGEKNYVLASHRSDKPTLLFTPLDQVSKGENIFVTDKDRIYQYEISTVMEVTPDRGDLMDDVPNEKIITLITCSDIQGTNRVIVRGNFITSWSFDEAPAEAKKAFDVPVQTY